MAVDDHGLEVLKKAGESVVPGSLADYYIKTKDIHSVSDPLPVINQGLAITPTIYNVPVGLTEVNQALSSNVKRFSIKLRNSNANLQVGFLTGLTNYITVPPGAGYEEINLNATGLTLYFKSDKAGQMAEIIEWV